MGTQQAWFLSPLCLYTWHYRIQPSLFVCLRSTRPHFRSNSRQQQRSHLLVPPCKTEWEGKQDARSSCPLLVPTWGGVQGSSGGTRQSQSCDLLVDFTNQDTSSKLIPSLHPLCELLAERRDKTSLCSRSSCQNRRGQLAETPEPPQKSPGPDAGSESAQHAARSTVLNPGS